MSSLNQHNQQFYLKNKGTSGIPDLLAVAIPIQESLRLCIESRIKANPIKVLELGFGSRLDRYTHIAKATDRYWAVTLSDFSLDVLPSPIEVSNITFNFQQINLLNNYSPIKKFDVILSTYAFDSIDFPEDLFKNGNHYPGGLIKIASKSLRYLNDNGIFITIDKWAKSSTSLNQSAGGAKFKSLDLTAAFKKLTNSCPQNIVELISLNEFLQQCNQSLPVNLSDHGCLILTK